MSNISEQDRILAAALNKLAEHERHRVFNPEFPQITPTEHQLKILKDNEHQVIHVVGGNRCLAKDTLVGTPSGPTKIQDLVPGDTVFDHNGNHVKVLKTFANGVKPVVSLIFDGAVLAKSTMDHVWACRSASRDKEYVELAVKDFTVTTQILKCEGPWLRYWHSVRVLDEGEVCDTFDIHIDSPENLYCLSNGLVTHNSGKSQLGARISTWWFNETHPHMPRPAAWGKRPLTLLVIGRVGEQIETELYRNKILPYLVPGTFTEKRLGGVLQRVEHSNGNRMLFFSHHSINEAREKVQAFTTDFIWLDEMADSSSFIAELMTRILTTDGKMICTFTPLVRSDEVRKMVDGAAGPAVKYRLSMLDNPMFKQYPERLKAVLALYKDMSESERNTRLNGDWYVGSSAVYDFSPARHCEDPKDYHPGTWRHVLSVDPAMSGKTGVTLWAEDPRSGVWYCVLADYLEGVLHPDDVVLKVEAKVKNHNIIRRVYDTSAPWFLATAVKLGYKYMPVLRKKDRKDELTKNFQSLLSSGKGKIAHHCTLLKDELIRCQRSETNPDKLVNSSSYHLIDAAQYFVDLKPKFIIQQPETTLESFESNLRKKHKERKAATIKMRRGGARSWKRRSG